ncbi:putative glucan endo-1,3-beta-glucosidase btgC [Erysiphe neolycopersici]|uniref:glucan endo-1,3-beta-D-glucosidase n=1 Tax=Erysiphe neolycopersici TaxID=212602 RepID=A0A420HF57_9PEZI|nr:putative glucan endo-1,3-beta-glucosidase btgC [Erysiphe neolycopersici]
MSRRYYHEHPRQPNFQGKRLLPRVPVDFSQSIQADGAGISHNLRTENHVPLELHKALSYLEENQYETYHPSLLKNSNSLSYHQEQQENCSVTLEDRYAFENYRAQALNSSAPNSSLPPGVENYYLESVPARVMENSHTVTNGHHIESDQEVVRNSASYAIESHSELSHTSPLATAAMTNGNSTPQSRSAISNSSHILNHEQYIDIPYRYSKNIDSNLCDFDPRNIEDDGDDGLGYKQHAHRSSVLSFGNSDRNGSHTSATSGASKGTLFGSLATGLGKKPVSLTSDLQNHDRSNYTRNIENEANEADGAESTQNVHEKSEWLSKQSNARSRLRLLVLLVVTIVMLGGVTGAIVNSVLHKKSSSNTSGLSAADDRQSNGDLDKNSPEIKKLLNNSHLHKVFPAIDYTPSRSQYPDCLHDPPSQNDVTRDLAVLSQLSNTIRLYGTDCNQTEMLIHSINQLDLKKKVRIWMGVWLNQNETTNNRQISQMYNILDIYGTDLFEGIIVGNEVLFRQDMTPTELGNRLAGIKSNLSSKGISLPVASSDLGDDWTAQLASKTDVLMANIHPFFAGVTADVAASWTWNFWQQHNVVLQPDLSKNIISETGWPSSGGISCGGADTCTKGSVASVDAMNTFMNDWVCQALANGTNYFWFEAFDEPWKSHLNEPGKEWEDKWGLLDAQRNLKPGIIIPNCDGKTV